jgi:hypothetical protein
VHDTCSVSFAASKSLRRTGTAKNKSRTCTLVPPEAESPLLSVSLLTSEYSERDDGREAANKHKSIRRYPMEMSFPPRITFA